MRAAATEQAHGERHEMTDELFVLSEDAVADLEFIGFDDAPTAEPVSAKAEIEEAEALTPAKPARQRRAKARTLPHSVRIWLDDRELLKLSGSADAAGIALAEYLRARVLKDPKARTRLADLAQCGPDLFLPAASPTSIPAPAMARLSSDLEERINAYYAPGDRLDMNVIPSGRDAGDLAQPNRLSRLGQVLTELFGTRQLGHRALPREGT
jgi:hypothetical protein